MTIKELYNQIDVWFNNNDQSKIKFLLNDHCYDDTSDRARFQKTINWYNSIKKESSEIRDIILGDKILTIKDISDWVLKNNIKPIEDQFEEEKKEYENDDDDYYEDYDDFCNDRYCDSGYANPSLVADIREFWENLDEYKIYSFAINETDDYEVDLAGGRHYMNTGIHPLTFNYMNYTYKNIMNEEELLEWSEYEYYLLKECFLPESDVLNRMYKKESNKKHKEKIDRFNYMIKNILDNFKKDPFFAEKIEIIKGLKIE